MFLSLLNSAHSLGPGKPAAGVVLTLTVLVLCAASARGQESAVNFNRDIRPILSDACFHCHGPDAKQRQAELRFDQEDSALAQRDGGRAIVPGNAAASLLVQRITTSDPDLKMPPVDSGRKLSAEQIDLLRRWIDEGAKWQGHWAFIAPVRSPLPQVSRPGWVNIPIDAFVLARLDRERLSPAPEADRATLLRRVTLDLTGLPPTPAEIDAFAADDRPDAYERQVDRLLASPHYGERMAARWLDGARYADTNGYQSDGERFMWRWRDWVIEAYNANMPLDEFTVEQIAGDMLPGATLSQIIATGFNRNHRGNAEGGIIPEEYAVEYVVDRVETTATVWLGLTLGCARCHDHKYDPVTQKEFYRLFAYFNNVPEKGKAVKFGNSPPMIKAPTREQAAHLAELQSDLNEATAALARHERRIAREQTRWESSFATAASSDSAQWDSTDWWPHRGLVAHWPLDEDAANRLAAAPSDEADSGKKSAAKAGFQGGEASFAPGQIRAAADLDGKTWILAPAGKELDFGFYDKFSCGAWVHVPDQATGAILARMEHDANLKGYNVHLRQGKVQANFCARWLDDAIRVETIEPLAPRQWHHVLMTYDGSRTAGGVRIYVDGVPQELHVYIDELNQTFNNSAPLSIGARAGEELLCGRIDDVRIYSRCLEPDEALVLSAGPSIAEIATTAPQQRSAAEAAKLRACFLDTRADDATRRQHQQVVSLQDELRAYEESLPTTMVMQEMATPRHTHVLIRGQYDKPGEEVSPGVPACLSPLPAGEPNNRLGLARWLVDPANPLTARVAVNRAWQMYFGQGIVKTVDDFGAQGDWPSHPELLDWLATELVHTGWDGKALARLIVTSSTYRQSSQATAALVQRDPDNRLLARGPRLRLSAEIIRDQALAASGLLVDRLGGPSVMPYQPAGLWLELTGKDFTQDHGEKLYRRSLYTFWKRTIAPPSMMNFDASARETCIVRESRTNTPLQALTLMNDVTYVEAGRVLAQRVLREAGRTAEERLTLAFRLLLGRSPHEAELAILSRGLAAHRQHYRQHPDAAEKLLAGSGEFARPAPLDPVELAAYTTVCGLILNLDETITKN